MLYFVAGAAKCHQWQFKPQGVRHVNSNAGKAVKERKPAKHRAGELTPIRKARRQKRGNQQLQQSSTPQSWCSSHPAEKQVAPLMYRQVQIIEQRQLAPVE